MSAFRGSAVLRAIGAAYTAVLLTIALLPVLGLLWISLSPSMTLEPAPHGFSLASYQRLVLHSGLRSSLLTSLAIGVLSATIAVSLAFLAGRRHQRGRGSLGDWYDLLLVLPFVCPLVSLGLMQLVFFSLLGLPRSALTVALGQSSYTLPLISILVVQGFRRLEVSTENAAANLGATTLDTLAMVTLPQLRSIFLSAWLIAFTISLQDHVLSWFLSGLERPLGAVLYGRIGGILAPELFAAGAISWLSFILVLVATAPLLWNIKGRN